MKAVQIGILAALAICAALLYKVYSGQQPQPQPQAATQPAQAPAPAAAQPAEPAAVPPPEVTPVSTPAPEPARAVEPVKKPSPTRRVPEREPARRRTEVAENRPAPAQSQAPAQMPPPIVTPPAPAPSPAAEPQTAMSAQPEPPKPEPKREPQKVTIPAGTTISVRLAETINSEQRQAGDTFTATLDQPLIVDGLALAERGAKVQGKIVEAQQAGRVRGLASVSLALTKIHTSDGQDIALTTETFAKQGEKSTGEDLKKVGVGAAIGAAIGAIAGGGKGAAIGAGVGGAAGAGTVAATRGKPVELPVETRLTFRTTQPVTVTERLP